MIKWMTECAKGIGIGEEEGLEWIKKKTEQCRDKDRDKDKDTERERKGGGQS